MRDITRVRYAVAVVMLATLTAVRVWAALFLSAFE